MITLGTNLASKVTQRITAPRLFLVMTFGAVTNRWTTGATVTWNSNSYTKRNFVVTGLRWEDGGISECQVEFNTDDQVMIALLLGSDAIEAQVEIYATNKMTTFGTDDVIKIFDGEVTDLRGRDGTFVVKCEPKLLMSPREYLSPNFGANTVDGPGVYGFGALGVVTIG